MGVSDRGLTGGAACWASVAAVALVPLHRYSSRFAKARGGSVSGAGGETASEAGRFRVLLVEGLAVVPLVPTSLCEGGGGAWDLKGGDPGERPERRPERRASTGGVLSSAVGAGGFRFRTGFSSRVARCELTGVLSGVDFCAAVVFMAAALSAVFCSAAAFAATASAAATWAVAASCSAAALAAAASAAAA